MKSMTLRVAPVVEFYIECMLRLLNQLENKVLD